MSFGVLVEKRKVRRIGEFTVASKDVHGSDKFVIAKAWTSHIGGGGGGGGGGTSNSRDRFRSKASSRGTVVVHCHGKGGNQRTDSTGRELHVAVL